MMNNKVNITRLQTDMEKALGDIEKLKDKIREGNGVTDSGE
jgi:peptidoglycan hydrolase CwlO-like protein